MAEPVQIKQYRVVEKIKQGSVGTVYKVADRNNKVLALKLISERNAAIGRKLDEFKREAGLGAKLAHKNIVKVFEYDDNGGRPFFVMEYFHSENLKYALWHKQAWVHKNEFYVLRQIAESLAYVHGLGIVHRDVKPENVLINENSAVKLIDFSLSLSGFWMKLFSRRRAGTPVYMAPEQILGKKADARTDIYSFGVLMYEVLTKRPPFIGVNEASLLDKHVKAQAAPMRNHLKTISADLDVMVGKMLEKDPDSRYPDMTSIIYELSKWEKKDTVLRIQQVQPAPARDDAAKAP